jgi:hypothetical protein
MLDNAQSQDRVSSLVNALRNGAKNDAEITRCRSLSPEQVKPHALPETDAAAA